MSSFMIPPVAHPRPLTLFALAEGVVLAEQRSVPTVKWQRPAIKVTDSRQGA